MPLPRSQPPIDKRGDPRAADTSKRQERGCRCADHRVGRRGIRLYLSKTTQQIINQMTKLQTPISRHCTTGKRKYGAKNTQQQNTQCHT